MLTGESESTLYQKHGILRYQLVPLVFLRFLFLINVSDRPETFSSLQCLYFARFFDIVDCQHSLKPYCEIGANVMNKKMRKENRTYGLGYDNVCKRVLIANNVKETGKINKLQTNESL